MTDREYYEAVIAAVRVMLDPHARGMDEHPVDVWIRHTTGHPWDQVALVRALMPVPDPRGIEPAVLIMSHLVSSWCDGFAAGALAQYREEDFE